MKITYQIDFQFKKKESDMPVAAGNVITTSGDETPMMLIPAVGDFVQIGGNPEENENVSIFQGVVLTRVFRYERQSGNDVYCHINIVVEESPQNFAFLIQE